MARKTNKYVYLFVLQGDYGHGWEDIDASEKRRDMLRSRRDYLLNEGGVYRIVQRRAENA